MSSDESSSDSTESMSTHGSYKQLFIEHITENILEGRERITPQPKEFAEKYDLDYQKVKKRINSWRHKTRKGKKRIEIYQAEAMKKAELAAQRQQQKVELARAKYAQRMFYFDFCFLLSFSNIFTFNPMTTKGP